MDIAEKEYAEVISSNDASKLALFIDKYGVENSSQNKSWSNIVHYANEHCNYVARKEHAANIP